MIVARPAVSGWLLIFRLYAGAFWLVRGIPKFLNPAMFMPPNGYMGQMLAHATQTSTGFYHDFLINTVTPNVGLFADVYKRQDMFGGFPGLITAVDTPNPQTVTFTLSRPLGPFLRDTIVVDGFRTANMEGYLFPDTYLMPLGASPATVEAIMSAQFRKELPADAARKARARGLTVPQVVTLASLIEREAKADDERPLMAGVYYNRLRLGMPLEVDATIEYALPTHQTVITYSDLRIDSPYNSYLHQGLPPTPIANPGRPSLVAALNPRPSEFLYYVYKGHGHHAFAKTLAEQNANVAKYLK